MGVDGDVDSDIGFGTDTALGVGELAGGFGSMTMRLRIGRGGGSG